MQTDTRLASQFRSTDQEEWKRIEYQVGVVRGGHHLASKYDSSRRVYYLVDQVVKVERSAKAPAQMGRHQSLLGEAEILRRLENKDYTPRVISESQTVDATWIRIERIKGIRIGLAPLSFFSAVFLFGNLISMSRCRVAHNDLTEGNVLMVGRRPVFIDFDQAVVTTVRKALLANLLGLPRSTCHSGLINLLAGRFTERLPPIMRRTVRRVLHRRSRNLPRLPTDASSDLQKVRHAWSLAVQSDASSPGISQAYYRYVFEGVRFPGERPWAERWCSISGLVDLKGLRVLELGCNMALLSTYALLSGATEATAVDRDETILNSASLLASAHGVLPEFRQIDFDEPGGWEDEIDPDRYDLVFALNVLHWVRDRGHFLSYLSRANALILEGHDPLSTEVARLRSIGFTVTETRVTDRGRPLILATRRRDAT